MQCKYLDGDIEPSILDYSKLLSYFYEMLPSDRRYSPVLAAQNEAANRQFILLVFPSETVTRLALSQIAY